MEALRSCYPKRRNHVTRTIPLLLVAVLCHAFSFGFSQSLPRSVKEECIIQIAKSQVGVVETRANWGRDVSAYLKSVGIKDPAPWCAAFTYWVYMMYSCEFDYERLKLGFVPNWSRGEMAQYVVWDKRNTDVKIQEFEFRPGDLCTIYFQNLKRDAHIFIVIEKKNGQLITIEGNTNDGGSRDGYGVFIRQRSLNSVSKVIRIIN